jgi:hypothetical protein
MAPSEAYLSVVVMLPWISKSTFSEDVKRPLQTVVILAEEGLVHAFPRPSAALTFQYADFLRQW